MHRRDFITKAFIVSPGGAMPFFSDAFYDSAESEFARKLVTVGGTRELEGYYVWYNSPIEDENGILLESQDGIVLGEPKIAYYAAEKYITQPPAPPHLKKYGRFERPQILFRKNEPAYLFTTSQGGKYMTSSPFIFRIS